MPQERGYRRLAAAVIVSAVRDLEKPTRAGGESVRAADVDMNTILRTYCPGGKVARIVGDVERDTFGDVVTKPLPGRPVRVHGKQARNTVRKSGSAP